MPGELLQVRELSVEFLLPRARVPAVRQVSFSIAPGEVLGLVGESGSGKSATALALLRLLVPQARISGEVKFQGRYLLRLSENEMRSVRGAGISMIFQEPMSALNPVMRVGSQIEEAVWAHRGEAAGKSARISKREACRRSLQAMEDVAIPDAALRARNYPHQLSGGMQQRVMIAMAIVNRPQLLIADEPTTALDVTIQAQVLDLLADLRKRFQLATLFISHDLGVVARIADRIAVMYAGSIVEIGTAQDVFRRAVHPYTRGLLNAVPSLKTDRKRPLETIEGTVPAMNALPPGCAFEPRCHLRIEDCQRALPPLEKVAPGHWARCPVSAAQLTALQSSR